MISMVEGAKRQKTPNELALTILLVGLTVVFLLVVVTLMPFSIYAVSTAGGGTTVTVTVLVALLVCLIPTTIGGLLSAIGVAGMSRMMGANVIATSGRAVEAAGDVDVLLLDKTGTITFGNRQASTFLPAPGVSSRELADAARLASLADETPEGRSIVALADKTIHAPAPQLAAAEFVPFTAQSRMSGVNVGERMIRKGAVDAVAAWIQAQEASVPDTVLRLAEDVARAAARPCWSATATARWAWSSSGHRQARHPVALRRAAPHGHQDRDDHRRQQAHSRLHRGRGRRGRLPGRSHAGSQAQADPRLPGRRPAGGHDRRRHQRRAGAGSGRRGRGHELGTQAAKEAGNMVDLDSNPTKLIEIVEIGKQMLMTRGALTTFSVANDVAKYFAIIPAAFATVYPQLNVLNIMALATPASAILSAVIFNALIIVVLIPLALKGVRYRPLGAAVLLRRNLLIYGLGGLLVPFVGIKLVDMVLAALGWV